MSYSDNHIKFEWDCTKGTFSLDFGEQGLLADYCAAFCGENAAIKKTTDYRTHEMRQMSIEDALGAGECFVYRHFSGDGETLVQEFVFYKEGYMTVCLRVESDSVRTNYMAPVYYEGDGAPVKMDGKIRFLAAPFDNDKWARFVDYPIEYAAEGYEFTAVHAEGRRDGLVIGSIDHDTWKTGLKINGNAFQVYCGAATEDTRDLNGISHGYVTAETVSSARIFLAGCADYQKGFRRFGYCNAAVKPALEWEGPVIFGWNSWAALMGDLTLERYKEASDYMKTLKHTYCGEDGGQYINFDAFWDHFSNKMQEAVAYVEGNGQFPGTYFCPFIAGGDFHQEVSGTSGNYCYEDILLKDHDGKVLPPVDGLYSLDPTHPGTLMHMEYELDKIIRWGFRSIKTDFVGHGCREGAFYRPEITTGVQAYCFGMQHFTECLKKAPKPVFVSLSIAPVFPHGYGHARRISCDAFGSLDQSAYLNNCITYLWWMNDCLYRFNDPDHIVTYKTYDKHSITLEEARTRYHAGVICGSLMITSDDYRMDQARERAGIILGNEKLNQIARKGESFMPVSGEKGDQAADCFVREDADGVKAAVFNYSISDEKEMTVPLAKLGMTPKAVYAAEDLWTGETVCIEGENLVLRLLPAQSRMFRIYPADTGNAVLSC